MLIWLGWKQLNVPQVLLNMKVLISILLSRCCCGIIPGLSFSLFSNIHSILMYLFSLHMLCPSRFCCGCCGLSRSLSYNFGQLFSIFCFLSSSFVCILGSCNHFLFFYLFASLMLSVNFLEATIPFPRLSRPLSVIFPALPSPPDLHPPPPVFWPHRRHISRAQFFIAI